MLLKIFKELTIPSKELAKKRWFDVGFLTYLFDFLKP